MGKEELVNIETILENSRKRRAVWQRGAVYIWNSKLWFWQKWWLRFGGRIHVRDEQLEPGKVKTALYLFYCQEHDSVDIDYEHYYGKELYCSLCDLQTYGSLPKPVPPLEPLAA